MRALSWILCACLAAAAIGQRPLREVELDGAGYRISAVLGDVDGDGIADLVVGNNGAFEVRKGLSTSPPAFAEQSRRLQRTLTPTCESACEPRLVDVDGDGDLDLVSLQGVLGPDCFRVPTVVWLPNDGSGRFGALRVIRDVDGELLTWRGEPSAVALVDWDGDGLRDLLVATPQLWVYPGTERGFAPTPRALEVSSRSFVVSDWDGDGDLDVLAQAEGGLVVHRRLGVIGGVGGVVQLAGAEVLAPVAEADPPVRLSGCDWDGDGRQDVLVGHQVRAAAQPVPDGVLADERQRIAAARRVLASIHAELDKLNRSRPPLDDPEAMARRSRRREELRQWAAAPRALVDRLEARRRAAMQPDVRGVLRVLLR